ncbi:hypothetical protein ACIQK9_21865 [Streptomyces hydrogenans]|uniref:hypothetical protein n=1 Tax=Streptomyces hydrogenans TaxID=1873719 RepID=UPI00380FDF18
MIVDLSNYELAWPTSLFMSEGERILRAKGSGPTWLQRVEWLLTEALVGSTAVADFQEVGVGPADWGSTRASRYGSDPQEDWFSELVGRASEIRSAATPRPYWTHRQGRTLSSDRSTARAAARHKFVQIVNDFADNGYLAEQFKEYCVDGPEELPDASALIARRLGLPGPWWPLKPAIWDEDIFYGLIEVFHDLVSRPRLRSFHSYGGCGWHHSEFHNGPARVLYRAKINEVLREAGIEYELAAEGEDLGRLVAATDDARSQLVHRVLNDSPPAVTDRVRHSVALFRARDASLESKRSAIVVAAGILEERRTLIRKDLGKPDEGALFEIANRFGLRHRRADQLTGYDDAFLDWIFWWYLATIELTNKLIEAAEPQKAGTASEPPF